LSQLTKYYRVVDGYQDKEIHVTNQW